MVTKNERYPKSATFSCHPDAPVMPQAIYPLGHADFDGLELFLVPIGQDADGTKYQAAVIGRPFTITWVARAKARASVIRRENSATTGIPTP